MIFLEATFFEKNFETIMSIGYSVLGISSVLIIVTVGYYIYHYLFEKKDE